MTAKSKAKESTAVIVAEEISFLTKEFLQGLSAKLDWREVNLTPVGVKGKVIIQELTAGLRDYWEASMISDAQEGRSITFRVNDEDDGPFSKIAGELMRSRIVALSLAEIVKRDDAGTPVEFRRLFKPGDEAQVKTWPSKVVNLIAGEAMTLNGITPEEFKQIKNDSALAAVAASECDLPANGESPSGD